MTDRQDARTLVGDPASAGAGMGAADTSLAADHTIWYGMVMAASLTHHDADSWISHEAVRQRLEA